MVVSDNLLWVVAEVVAQNLENPCLVLVEATLHVCAWGRNPSSDDA